MDFRHSLLNLIDRSLRRINEPRALVAGIEGGSDDGQGGKVTPVAIRRVRITVRASLLLGVLGFWVPEQ